MNLLMIMKTLHKIRAVVTVLVGRDSELANEINTLYLQTATLGVGKKAKANCRRYGLTSFLEMDERAILARRAGLGGTYSFKDWDPKDGAVPKWGSAGVPPPGYGQQQPGPLGGPQGTPGGGYG